MAIVQALIDKGADLNTQDERNATPLHRAASKVIIPKCFQAKYFIAHN
jgi:hypothetical protein